MTKLRDKKGAITMITLITVLFLVSFLMSSYIIVSNKVKTQKEILNETKSIYEPKVTMEEIYNSYFSNDTVIPIYTVNQLLSIGNNEKINIDGKIYTFSSDKVYVLKNNLEFSAIDLGLETDWIPTYNSGNFEWNDNTIKVTTLSGNIITYSKNTTTGYPIILADAKGSTLADYKIYGNSVQNGTPTPETPIEVKSVGDLITDESDANYGKYAIPIKISVENGNEQTFNIILDEPLRKIGNYYDYIDFSNGKIERNIAIGEISDVSSIYSKRTNVIRFSVYVPTISYKVETHELLSEFLIYKGSWLSDEEYIFKHNSTGNHFYISFLKTRIGYEEGDSDQVIIEKANNYIKTLSNTKVYYPMAIPIEETIELPNIQLNKGKNTITIDTEVKPSNVSVTYTAKQ